MADTQEDLERLRAQRRRAHEAGDTEAARRFTQRIRAAQGGGQPAPLPTVATRSELEAAGAAAERGGRMRTEPGEVRAPDGGVTKAEGPIRLAYAAGQGARRGFEGMGGTLGALGNLAANVPGLGFLQNPYGYEGAEQAGRNLFGENFQPSGRAEEAIALAGEFASGVTPAALGRQATTRGLPVARNISETILEELTPAAGAIAVQQTPGIYGSEYQGAGELVGGLATGIATSTRRAFQPTAEQLLADRLRNITPEQFETARRLSEIATEMGFPISADEALKSPELRRLAAQVQAGSEGSDLYAIRQERLDSQSLESLNNLAETNPGRFRTLMDNFLSENLAPSGQRAVEAATKTAETAAQDLRRRRTAATTPFYQAASEPGQDVDAQSVQDLVDEVDRLIARQPEGSRGAAQLRAFKQRLQVTDDAGEVIGLQTNAGALDQAYQEFSSLINVKPGDPRSTLAEGIGAVTNPVRVLREITEQNDNIRRGREIHQRYSRRLVEPLLRGPLGALSRGDPDALKRMSTLVDNFITGSDFNISDFIPFVNRMSAVEGGQEALEGLLTAYMNNVVEDSLSSTASGRRANPAAYFSSRIQGRHRQNLNALFNALDMADQRAGRPNPPNRRRAFSNLMNVLEATEGSTPSTPPSVSDAEILTRANASILTRLLQIARPLATPASVFSQEFADRRNRALVRETWETIGQAFADTSPEGIARLERMASATGTGREAFRAANELLMVRAPFVENRFDEEETQQPQ